MSLADELNKLAALRDSGALTEEEFRQAKEKMLSSPSPPEPPPPPPGEPDHRRSPTGLPSIFDQGPENDESLGKAANRYVTFQMVMAMVGIALFLIVAPVMCSQMPRNVGPSNYPGFPR